MSLLQSLQESSLALAISESAIVFPWIESVHVLALVFVVGSIAVVDLKLLGWASGSDRVARMLREVVPWTVGAFGVAAISGALLFISNAERYWASGFFKAKLAVLVFAGLNMLLFHFQTGSKHERWDRPEGPPLAARIAGGLSLSSWILIIFLGRWVGFSI